METNTPTAKFKSLFNYRKHKFNIISRWDEGSKSNYFIYSLDSGKFVGAGSNSNVKLQFGQVMVETGIFRGKSATALIYYYEQDEARAKELFN